MKTLQEQYNLIKEGKGHKGVFLKEAKRLFPNIVPNSATFNQTTKLLKQRSVINETIFPLMPSSGLNPFTTFDRDWETVFLLQKTLLCVLFLL